MVFFISAIFHEVLVGVPLHMLRLWAFWGLMLQVRGRGVSGQWERVLLLLGREHGRCLGGLLAAQLVCEEQGRAGSACAAPSNGSPGPALGQPEMLSLVPTHGSPACCTPPTTAGAPHDSERGPEGALQERPRGQCRVLGEPSRPCSPINRCHTHRSSPVARACLAVHLALQLPGAAAPIHPAALCSSPPTCVHRCPSALWANLWP